MSKGLLVIRHGCHEEHIALGLRDISVSSLEYAALCGKMVSATENLARTL